MRGTGTGLSSSEVFTETKIAISIWRDKRAVLLLSCWIPELFSFVHYVPRRLGMSCGADARSTAANYHQAWEGGSAGNVNLVICTLHSVYLNFSISLCLLGEESCFS